MSLKIYFGSYESHGIIRHKIQRFIKVIQILSKLKYEVELIPSSLLNTITIYMKSQEIFRCSIRSLLFNIDYEEDRMAQKMVKAIEDAAELFYSPNNIPKFSLTKEGRHDFDDFVIDELLFEIGHLERERTNADN